MKKLLTLKNQLIALVITLAFVTGATIGLHAQVYVNSSSGNDATGSGTAGNPYKTFHKGYTMVASGGTIDLTGTFTWTDADETGDAISTGYTLSKNITIQGQGAGLTIVQAATTTNTGDRAVLKISNGYSVTLKKVSIRNGVGYDGGGIAVYGVLNIDACEINGNKATSGGGGIAVYGSCTITNSIVNDNTALYQGGGLVRHYYSGTTGTPGDTDILNIINCTITLNTVTSASGTMEGGGVYFRRGTGSITNSTISQNKCTNYTGARTHGVGVGYDAYGVKIKNNIIVNNYVTYNSGKDIGIRDTDFSQYTDNGNNVFGAVSSTSGFASYASTTWIDGKNTVMDGIFVLQDGLGTTTGVIALSSTLANNSTNNYTQTYALGVTSLAINKGGTTDNGTVAIPSTDQRGFARNGLTDIGAYEYDGTYPPVATWTGVAGADWNTPGNWDINLVPTTLYNVEIPDVTNDPVIASGTTGSCNNLTINSGATLTIQSTASGTGSLITNGTVTGNLTIQRYVTGSTNLDQNKYHLVSVPLNPANNSLSDLFMGSYLYEYLPATNVWNGLNTSTTTSLSENKGYMMYYPNTSTTYTFTGEPNTGTFTPTVTYPGNGGGNNFALVPNPYPSNIDWNAASGWTKTNIGTTIWVYNPAYGNYATWNGTSATNGGARYIGVGQAFFVQTTASSPSLVMGNGVRTHTSATFLKNGNGLDNQLRMKAEANGKADEALVGFDSQAASTYDAAEDALKFYGAANAPQLYTVCDDHDLSINNSGALNGNAEIPLNYKSEFEGETVLTFSQIENFPGNVSIYLKDELTGQTMNLRNQPVYAFSHQAANPVNRFKLVFGSAIGIDDNPEASNRMWITNNTLYISTPKPSSQSAKVEIYNTSGQLVTSQSVVLNELTTLNLNLNGPVVARLTTNGTVLTARGIAIRR